MRKRKYECWIIHDDSGNIHGHYDCANAGFDGACYACAYLNETYLETYSMVVISGARCKR